MKEAATHGGAPRTDQGGGASEERTADATYGLPPVLTVDEAAAFLRVNRKTLYDAINARQVPARRVGKRTVLLRDALLGWLAERVLPRS